MAEATKCPRCKTGNKVGPRIVTPEMHQDVVAEWCDNEACEYWKERPAERGDYGATPRDVVIQTNMTGAFAIRAVDRATKIVVDFEAIFGKLTTTERRWLTRRISGQEV